MTDNDKGEFREFPDLPPVDWSQMEQLANGAKEEDLSDTGPSHVVLSDDMIAKRILWDIAPHELFEQVAAHLGVPPSSDDVLDMEHTEAHHRLSRVLMVAPPLDVLSHHAAKAVMATMLVMNDQTDELAADSEEFADSVEKMEVVIFNTVLASIAELVDWGLLHTPHIIGSVGAGNEEAMAKIAEAIQTAVAQAQADIENEDNEGQ